MLRIITGSMIETFDYDRETRKQSLRRKTSESPSQKDNFLQHCAPSVHRVRVSTLSSNITVTSWCLWGKTLVAKMSDVTRQQLGDPSQHCTSFFGATSITAHSSSSPDSPSWMKSRCLSPSFADCALRTSRESWMCIKRLASFCFK